jgi:hypothetical protein
MNQSKAAKSLVLILLSTQMYVAIAAPLPERATAQYYFAPPTMQSISNQAVATGQSSSPPPILEPYLHKMERQTAAYWIFDVRQEFGADTVVYAGYSQNHLVNVLHFLKAGGQRVFLRQYVVHYARTVSGDNTTTVERYEGQPGSSEKLVSTTSYLSKLIDNKLYLSTVEWVDAYGAQRFKLAVQWTENGVQAMLTQTPGTPANIDLKADSTWLRQHFDLWNDFGLKFRS